MQLRRPRLEGKVAIVTGGGERESGPRIGTGKAMSILFAREGAKVLVVDRVLRNAEATVAAIREEGGEASVFEADVTKAEDCQEMAEAAKERYGGLHVLINNAGIFIPEGPGVPHSSVVDVTETIWDQVMNVNLKGMMLVSKYVIPKMIESGGGAIVNISSTGGMRGNQNSRISYNTSKASVIGMTTMMAAQHGRDKVRVNCIAPGGINTPMLANEEGSASVSSSPLGTVGTGWDIAWAALFLASDEARWITGVLLPVDAGGSTAAGGTASEYMQL